MGKSSTFERDYKRAVELENAVNNWPDDKMEKFRNPAIANLKHMLWSSTEKYADTTAIYQKYDKNKPFTEITYKELFDRVNALGTKLIDMGLKGKRISMIGENSSEWAISYLAAVCGTGVCVPLDKELNEQQLEQLIKRADVSCVLFKKKHEQTFRNIKERGETNLDVLINMDADEDNDGVFSMKKLIEEGKAMIESGDNNFVDAEIDAEELAVIIFTSGTTGKPKGVMLSHRNICVDLMISPPYVPPYHGDIFFSVLPMHHTYECTCGFLMPLYKGSSIAYCQGLKYIVKDMQEIRPHFFLMVPAIMEALHKNIFKEIQKQGKEKLVRRLMKVNHVTQKANINIGKKLFKPITDTFGGRMRMMIVGGAAINPKVLDDIKDLGIMALQGYGLTECAPMGALNPDYDPHSDSIGKCFPACEMKIDNPDEDGIGEICIKGGNVMMGYYEMPEETAEVIKDGWLYTGDIGYIDEEGYAIITGRAKNVIIAKNGKNIYPEEIEYELSNIPIVAESMVFGEETADGDDIHIVANIRLDKTETEDMFGEDIPNEKIEEYLWEEIEKFDSDQPYWRKIKKIKIRERDFVKNTSQKIIRFEEDNKLS